MIEETDFKTFLYISKNKYQIFVNDKINFKSLYNKELEINKIELETLTKFLDQNIYNIEKIVSNFMSNIILIIEDDKVLNVGISIKKKNYKKYINQKYLENCLTEVKDIFRENYQDQIIMHMVIVNNDTKKIFSSNNNNDYLFLEVNFICISSNFTYIFNKLLEDHQIKIGKYMSGAYIRSFFGKDVSELQEVANKLDKGLNKNEVKLISKNREIEGFFERFFQLFS